jgi:hypothetical protein
MASELQSCDFNWTGRWQGVSQPCRHLPRQAGALSYQGGRRLKIEFARPYLGKLPLATPTCSETSRSPSHPLLSFSISIPCHQLRFSDHNVWGVWFSAAIWANRAPYGLSSSQHRRCTSNGNAWERSIKQFDQITFAHIPHELTPSAILFSRR